MSWLRELKAEFQSEQDCVTEIKTDLLCSKSTNNTMVQNAKQYEWNVIRKMLKHQVQNIETLCQNIMLKTQMVCSDTEMLIYSTLKRRDTYLYIPCSNSELNVVIKHRAQDNSWTTDNFQSVLCCLSDHFCMTDHVWKVSCLSSEWVCYIYAAYTTSSWPAAVTFCASLAVLNQGFIEREGILGFPPPPPRIPKD